MKEWPIDDWNAAARILLRSLITLGGVLPRQRNTRVTAKLFESFVAEAKYIFNFYQNSQTGNINLWKKKKQNRCEFSRYHKLILHRNLTRIRQFMGTSYKKTQLSFAKKFERT